MSVSLEVGTLVWAKMKSFPPWPGIVAQPMNAPKKPGKKSQHWIFFFGTKNYAWIDDAQISTYAEHKAQFSNSSKTMSFKEAIEEIEYYQVLLLQNPKFTLDNFLDEIVKNKSIDKSKEERRETTVSRKRRPTSSLPHAKKARAVEEEEEVTVVSSDCDEVVKNTFKIVTKRVQLEGPVSPSLDVSTVSQSVKDKNITPSQKRFGFIGLGLIGSTIVKNLIVSGHRVNIWNRTAAKANEIKAHADKLYPQKVEVCSTPSDLIYQSDIVFSCLSDATAVKSIVLTSTGILEQDPDLVGKGYVELSSIDMDTSRTIDNLFHRRGGRYLEAQLQGSKQEAVAGVLIVLAAGDRQLYDDCQTCFEAIGKSSCYLGEIGCGIKMNSVLQSIRGVQIAALAEALVLASCLGLSIPLLAKAISLSSLNCPALMEKSHFIIKTDFSNPETALRYMQKDMSQILELSHMYRQPLPVAAAANECFKHAHRMGYMKHDASAVYLRTRF